MMTSFMDAFTGYARYVAHSITHPVWDNFLSWLILLSALVWMLEIVVPWRSKQKIIRKDFWLDAWYMVFNTIVFSLVGYNAASTIVAEAVQSALSTVLGRETLAIINVHWMPVWAQLVVMFVARDFIQWNVHRLLHRVPWLWEFHKVHHSVEQMGFAAHLRYHWMETIVYRSIEYLPLALFGFGISEFLVVHVIALAIGHWNHANIVVPLGPLRYVLNNPQMHIWHHAKALPEGSYGVNYGISLSIWDYLFGTAWMPDDGRDVTLGFEDREHYPASFLGQLVSPFRTIASALHRRSTNT
jgi:sterol desaturase/sphingolipid hydroxylase (fatty acid hydroxylase superfamily)